MPLLMMAPLPKLVINTLKDFLAEELDLIDTEMADSIVTPDIEDQNFFERDFMAMTNYPALTIQLVDSVPVEVKPKQFGSRLDARHTLNLRVHVTSSLGNPENLQALLSRYAAGIIRVLCIRHERLDTLAEPFAHVDIVEWLRTLTYSPLPAQTEGSIVRTVSIPLSIRRREVRE